MKTGKGTQTHADMDPFFLLVVFTQFPGNDSDIMSDSEADPHKFLTILDLKPCKIACLTLENTGGFP